ncbi:xanthine dehydrogenase small subunit [Silvimonas terrae]|uniref:Xanthine dehydrogenase small subunit n=1 Tax=Silvimonas terrae TaxID=300266 RepID=A0A840RFZ0_9NEIS|nr:xanthine dehydrogenase small subunit [Silvimonas terrae]MBB5191330.1 xanthine dehydrogenase small subunit [Silvimonas terrae]
MSTRPIQFWYRGQIHKVDHVPPTRTVLQHLREDRHCTGSKEGCAEGDCGACTVVLGEQVDGELRLRAVNSCIQFLPTLDGKALFTVEDVGTPAHMHPVQQAMVECHGSQCGFCTPGFVMSLWAMYQTASTCPGREAVTDAISGNLCRCTGYRPILDAAKMAYELPRKVLDGAPVLAALTRLALLPPLHYQAHGHHFFAPRRLSELLLIRAEHPDARLLAGSTDVGLWVTKQLRELGDVIYLGQIAELKRIETAENGLEIGAGVALADAFAALIQQDPQWLELARRFASVPVRNASTLGGNIVNGSPIGDSMPALMVLGARLVLWGGDYRRELPLEAFYLGYQQNALEPGEILEKICVPEPPAQGRLFRTWKVSRRYEQDISAVCGAFMLHVDRDGVIRDARIAFGGMAATPKRAPNAEMALIGQRWTAQTARAAADALTEDYQPLSDLRASADYRMTVAANLLQRFWLETGTGTGLTRIGQIHEVSA